MECRYCSVHLLLVFILMNLGSPLSLKTTTSSLRSTTRLFKMSKIDNSTTQRKVAVIGAGAAGMACVQVLSKIEGVEVKAFEKSKYCGGVWNYAGNKKKDTRNPMYGSLRTNLPKEIMAYSQDFPFLEDELGHAKNAKADYDEAMQAFLTSNLQQTAVSEKETQQDPLNSTDLLNMKSSKSSYVTHVEMQLYLERYAHSFGLHKHVQYNTPVINVHKTKTEQGQQKWRVQTGSGDDGELFDYVAVCNGHYNVPFVPGDDEVPGVSDFPGLAVHSYKYDGPHTLLPDDNKITFNLPATDSDTTADSTTDCAEQGIDERGKRGLIPSMQMSTGERNLSPLETSVSKTYESTTDRFVTATTDKNPKKYMFHGKKVLVVGSRSSGTDIARELISVASEVHVSDRNRPGEQELAEQRREEAAGAKQSDSSDSNDSRALSPANAEGFTETGEAEKTTNLKQNQRKFMSKRDSMTSPNDYSVTNTTTNLFHHTGLRSYDAAAGEIEFSDGSRTSLGEDCVLIWCTGFKYAFDFLPGVERQDKEDLSTSTASIAARVKKHVKSMHASTGSTAARTTVFNDITGSTGGGVPSVPSASSTGSIISETSGSVSVSSASSAGEGSTDIDDSSTVHSTSDRDSVDTRFSGGSDFDIDSTINTIKNGMMSKSNIGGVRTNGRKVRGLYEHLFAAQDPTLCFVGIPFSVVPFPLFHLQARWLGAVVQDDIAQGGVHLVDERIMPPTMERLSHLQTHEDSLVENNAMTDSKYHYMGVEQWEYFRRLASLVADTNTKHSEGEDKEDEEDELRQMLAHIALCESIYNHNVTQRPKDVGLPDTYRSTKYTIEYDHPKVGSRIKQRLAWNSMLYEDELYGAK